MDNDWLETQTTPVSSTSYDHNGRGFLTSLVNEKTGPTTLSEFTIPAETGYDALGNLLSLTANLPNVGTEFSGMTTYQYDAKDQVTLEHSSRSGTEGYENSFIYDPAGNTTTLRDVGGRQFNDNNQNSAFTYDTNGNPIAYKGDSPLTYDEEDRLTGYSTDMTAGYTSDGLRAWKQVGPTRVYYLYSGATPICEIDSTTGQVTAVNTFGATGLLARREDGQDTFYTFDPQGNVSQTLEADGDIASTQLYDAYGALLSGGSTPPFGFGAQHGYYTDPETGLLLLTHRYYDPEEGRFLTRDPIGYSGGMNLYGYVGGNPVNAADPLGFCSDDSEKYPPHWRNFLNALGKEANPFDPNSALYKQGVSIGDYERGDLSSAAQNSGWAQLEEAGASPWEFRAYTGTQVVAGVAATAALTLGVAEMAGLINTVPQGNNILRIVGKGLGWRLDKPHPGHGKMWPHPHFWRWKP